MIIELLFAYLVQMKKLQGKYPLLLLIVTFTEILGDFKFVIRL